MNVKLKNFLIYLKRKILNEVVLVDENSIKKPLASKSKYLELYEVAKKSFNSEVNNFENELGYKIGKDWIDNLALHTQICLKKSKLNYNHGKLLYALIRKYLAEYKKINNNDIFILETGTARGFSSICMAKAINDTIGINGRILTIDILPSTVPMYWNIIDDHEKKKTRLELLNKWPEELKIIRFVRGKTSNILSDTNIDRVNFAFLDADHEYNSVIDEYLFLKEKQRKGDLIFFDDATPKKFPGIVKALKEIEESGLYTIKYFNFSEERSYALATKV